LTVRNATFHDLNDRFDVSKSVWPSGALEEERQTHAMRGEGQFGMIGAVGAIGVIGMIAALAALATLRCWRRRLVGGRPAGQVHLAKVEAECLSETSCCLSRASTVEHEHVPGLADKCCPAGGVPQSRGSRPARGVHGAGGAGLEARAGRVEGPQAPSYNAAFDVGHRQITPDEALLILEEMEQRLCVHARRTAAPTPRTRKLRFKPVRRPADIHQPEQRLSRNKLK